MQGQLLIKLRGETHPDLLRENRAIAAELRLDLALVLHDSGRSEEAQKHLLEALKVDDGNLGVQLALARIQMETGQLEQAQELCQAVRGRSRPTRPTSGSLGPNPLQSQVLARQPDHVEATLLLGEVLFHSESVEQAVFHFTNRLQAAPTDYSTLARYVTPPPLSLQTRCLDHRWLRPYPRPVG